MVNKVGLSRRKVLAGMVGGLAAPALAHTRKTLTVGVPSAYPFARMNRSHPEGIIADPMAFALQSAGMSVRYVQLQLDDIYRSVENGSLDGGLVMTAIGDRGFRAVYTKPVVQEYSMLVVSKYNPVEVRSVADLNELRLGGRIGFVYSSLSQSVADQIVRNPTDADTIRDLLLGKIDVAIVGGIKVMHELRAEGVMLHLRQTGLAVGHVGLGAAFSKKAGAPELVGRINKALSNYKNSSRWPALLQRHAASTLVRTPRVL